MLCVAIGYFSILHQFYLRPYVNDKSLLVLLFNRVSLQFCLLIGNDCISILAIVLIPQDSTS